MQVFNPVGLGLGFFGENLKKLPIQKYAIVIQNIESLWKV
jgi:hypothetical protein